MVARVQVVCTANICRSPYAEAALRHRLAAFGGGDGAVVTSSGTHARRGDPAAPHMVEVGSANGLDLVGHRSSPVDPGLLREQDLVVTMEVRHRDAVAILAPGLAQRTFTLPEVVACIDQVGRDGTTAQALDMRSLVRLLNGARVRHPVPAAEVADPYGGRARGYRTAADELDGLVTGLATALAPVLRA